MGKESGIGQRGKSAILRHLEALSLGQQYPRDYPPPVDAKSEANPPRLGRPLDIRGAAKLIGCSPWTVRQTLIPKGLPVFRSGASGKLIFYEGQVIRWIEKQQGGKQR